MSAARGTSSMTKAAGERNAIDEGNALPAKIFCMRPHRSGAQVARSKISRFHSYLGAVTN